MKDRSLTILFVILGLGALSAIFLYPLAQKRTRTPSPVSQPSRKLTKLKALVTSDGQNFEITNLDEFTWHVPKFTINAGIVNDPYVFQERYFIYKGETETYPACEFVNSKGQRFNSWIMKPMNFTIECDLTTPHDRGHFFSELRSTGR